VNPSYVPSDPLELSIAGLKFEGTVTRFTLPIRCLSFSASGSMLAAAGDDEGIKLISTLDSSIACIVKVSTGWPCTTTSHPQVQHAYCAWDAREVCSLC